MKTSLPDAEPNAARTPADPAPEVDLASLLGEPAARPWYRRPLLWTLALGLALAGAGLWWWQVQRAANALPSYNTRSVARGDLSLTVHANGTVQPTRTVAIGSELSGTVLKVNVDVNDRIKKGQVLVELDTAKLQDQIRRSQATLAAAQARVAQVGATVQEARATLGRLEEVDRLSGGQVPSRAELDGGRAALARALADGASARAGVTDAAAALSTDQINLSKASIVAPADGFVLTRSVDPGNAVAASLQAVTLFTVADDLTKLRLWVYVDEADVGSVKVGQMASFTVSAHANRKFPARITRVGFGSTITDNVVTYLTYLDVDNTELILRPGMTATAAITATQRRDVLLVPNMALRFRPSQQGAETDKPRGGMLAGLSRRMGSRRSAGAGVSSTTAKQVWVLRDGAAVMMAITPGLSDGQMTEVIGGDLRAGMQVITDQKLGAGE
jgi:HlyD family secretion protein